MRLQRRSEKKSIFVFVFVLINKRKKVAGDWFIEQANAVVNQVSATDSKTPSSANDEARREQVEIIWGFLLIRIINLFRIEVMVVAWGACMVSQWTNDSTTSTVTIIIINIDDRQWRISTEHHHRSKYRIFSDASPSGCCKYFYFAVFVVFSYWSKNQYESRSRDSLCSSWRCVRWC